MKQPIQVLIVDDHPLMRKGIRMTLEEVSEDFGLVGEADDGASALRQVAELRPDVVLMDIRMPGMDGLEALEHIRTQHPGVAVILLTTYNDDELVLRGLSAGAHGYLLKDCELEVLLAAIRSAAQGQVLLSPELLQRALMAAQPETSMPRQPPMPQASRKKYANDLTERELTILSAVARGERNKEIAHQLGISERTVLAHLTTIFAKLQVDSRTAAVAVALQQGLILLTNQNT
ncbi:response regulator [Dictyobacter kobayashii]|uniref:DNA-binding response regulator n=1 Tax=Dictyobacter kobayashii TaxID=2014872 RepID=A0A402AQU6_9CHLR|nr:response regulator transcription factor [Dictyobacter kobayashii]GCE21467.1 DNA-binding response regulator [Dictyobacter kobayashii]